MGQDRTIETHDDELPARELGFDQRKLPAGHKNVEPDETVTTETAADASALAAK